MLTSLAVAVAFSLGAGPLPIDAALPVGAAPDAAAPAWSPAGALPASGVPTVGSAPAVRVFPLGSGRAAAAPAGWIPVGAVPVGPAGRPVLRPATPRRAPAGLAPATVGSRAPPRG